MSKHGGTRYWFKWTCDGVDFLFSEDDPCPCESGKTARRCCADGPVFAPRQHLPPARKKLSGESLARCYAHELNDCHGVLSSEHFMSANLLERLAAGGGPYVSGFPYQKPEDGLQWRSVKSLGSNILCQRHNSDLSDLDTIAGHVVGHLEKIDTEHTKGDPRSWAWFLNGHDLERWMLKTFMGLVAANVGRFNDNERMAPHLEREWLDMLFRGTPFPKRAGLFVRAQIGDVVDTSRRNFTFAPVSVDRRPVGIIISLYGFEFSLSTIPVEQGKTRGAFDAHSLHRPTHLAVGQGDCRKVIRLHWDEPGDGHGIQITWKPTGDAPDIGVK